MIIIVDYGMGNLRSIQSKLHMLNMDSEICENPDGIQRATKLILPGVGNFAAGMRSLRERNLIPTLNELVLHKKIPVLGICLGMQLLGQHSEEGEAEGLGWLQFKVKRFVFSEAEKNESLKKLRVPHVGWNRLTVQDDKCLLFAKLPLERPFYFTHSYHAASAASATVAATTWYGHEFPSVVHEANIFGTQFHPEKSRSYGLKMVENFLRLA